MIKEKIIEIRQKNKLTQADFGKVLNIAQFTISRYDGTTRNIKQACTKHVPNMYQTCTKHVPMKICTPIILILLFNKSK